MDSYKRHTREETAIKKAYLESPYLATAIVMERKMCWYLVNMVAKLLSHNYLVIYGLWALESTPPMHWGLDVSLEIFSNRSAKT